MYVWKEGLERVLFIWTATVVSEAVQNMLEREDCVVSAECTQKDGEICIVVQLSRRTEEKDRKRLLVQLDEFNDPLKDTIV